MDESGKLEGLSDLELVSAINDGDEAAFATLYHRHKDWIVNLAFRWTGDRDLALDVLQESFFSFAKRFPGFRLTAKLQTFFYPVVRNLSINARRKSSRYHPEETQVPQVSAPVENAPQSGSQELFEAAFDGLGSEHRDVLMLRFVDGLSLAEIADTLGIPLGTVKSRLHHSLLTLRNNPQTKELFEP